MSKRLFVKLCLVLVLVIANGILLFKVPDATYRTVAERISNTWNSPSRDFTEISMNEALKMMKDSDEDVLLFFGFDDCPHCKIAHPLLLAVANEQNTNYKVRFIRTRDILGKLTYTEKQRKELTRYIPEYMSRNENMDNKLWLYVPTMIRLKDGKVVDGHAGLLGKSESMSTMTKTQEKELMKIYRRLLK